MLSVQTNLLAENANRNLKVNTGKNAKITEKLSSGYKINRAADDASGLSISEKMRRQIRGLNQSADNINEGVGYVQTAEGALNEVQDILQRINQLSVKAANGTNTPEDRAYIDQEIQQLKKEMSRIFSETTFNERKIWDYEPVESKEIVDYRSEKVVKFNEKYTYFDITNENCGVIAQSGYKINADEDGVIVSWTGYNGKSYETDTIGWEELEKNNYSFEISDHFKVTDTDLISPTTGKKLFNHTVSMSVNRSVPLDEIKDKIIDAIDGTTISQSLSIPISGELQDADGKVISERWEDIDSPVYFYNGRLTYTAAYVSYMTHKDLGDGYDFDAASNDFIYPTINGNTNLQCPSADNESWIFSLYMEGIGDITAESSSIRYWADDTTGTEDYWWHWAEYADGTPYKAVFQRFSGGTLGDVKSVLSPDNEYGLLNKSDYGLANTRGYINLTFNLKSGSTIIGSIDIDIPVKCGTNGETTQEVLDRIGAVFNSDTIFDIFASDKDVKDTSNSIHTWNTDWRGDVEVPVYGDSFLNDDTQNFFVQAGTEAGQHISIEYEFLSLEKLGMKDTNVLTQESAGNAIDEVKAALQIVSKQRSDFGAYQNRLEHAYNINKNVEENTQASESVIRDTDIAEMMMEYSVNNILMQAGTSMLTQANQSKQSVLELLN